MPSAQLKSIDAYEGDRNYVVRQLPIQDTDVQYIPLQSDDKVNVSEVDNVGNQHADSSVSDVSCDEERLKKKRKSKLLATDVDNTVEKNLEEGNVYIFLIYFVLHGKWRLNERTDRGIDYVFI